MIKRAGKKVMAWIVAAAMSITMIAPWGMTTGGVQAEELISLKDATVSLSTYTYTYTGEAFQPTVTVEINGEEVPADCYEVDWSNNINKTTSTSLAKATVTGIESKGYTGTNYKNFEIGAADIKSSAVTFTDETTKRSSTTYYVPYSKEGYNSPQIVKVEFNGVTLKEGTDYTINDNIIYEDVGTSNKNMLKIIGKGNFKSTKYIYWYYKAAEMSNQVVSLDCSNYTYDGTAKMPAVTVYDWGTNEKLEVGTDYTVSYSNNTEVGDQAAVILTGTGNYTGTKTVYFSIQSAGTVLTDISAADVTVASCTYNGKEQKPTLTVACDNKTLTEGKDYTTQWSNNTNAGTASVILSGKGSYTSSKTVNFTINKRNLSNTTIKAEHGTYNYGGSTISPGITVTDNDTGTVLTYGTDYTVSYSGYNAGDYTITAKAVSDSNYVGTQTGTYTVDPLDLTNIAEVTLEGDSFTYEGTAVEPKVSAVTADGHTLNASDYTVTYAGNTSANDNAKVIVNFTGNYTGSVTKTFTIKPSSSTEATTETTTEATTEVTTETTTEQHEHSYVESVTKKATCKEEGEMKHECSCGESYTTAIPKVDHTPVTDAAVAATCTTTGLTEGSHCSVCGEVITAQETIPATGHTAVTDAAVAATCTTDGKTEGSHCSVCKTVIKEQEKVPATGHTEVTDAAVAATCTETGLTEGSHCSVCKTMIKAQEEIPLTEHTYNDGVITKEATTTEEGIRTYTCTVCGYQKTEPIDKLPSETHVHSYTASVTKAATCTENGVKTYTCSSCEYSYTESIAATGHTEVTDAAVAATCTETGLTTGSHCSVCNTVIKVQETTAKAAHTPVMDVAVAATCTETGLTEGSHCSVCKTVIKGQEKVPATGHTAVTDAAVAATCTTEGKTEGSHCSVCKTVIKAQEEIPLAEHTYNDGVITKEATTTEEGVKTYTCTVCGYQKTEPIDKLPSENHEHSYTASVTKAATCTENGVKTYTCSSCEYSYTESIAATGHTEVADAAVAATCTETGLTEGSHCSVCGKVLVTQEMVAATGHTYTSEVTKESTTTEEGIRTYTCTKCGAAYTEAIGKLPKKTETKPSKVTKLQAKKIQTTSATITWKKVKGADGYLIYRKGASDKKAKLVKTTNAKTVSYSAKKLKKASKYTYTIYAYKKDGTTKVTSSKTSVTFVTKPAAVTKTKAVSKKTKTAKISWKKSTGADGYVVYMATSKKGKYKKISQTKKTSLTKSKLKQGKTYYFKVKAYKTYKGKKTYSGYSKTVKVKIK